MRFLALSVLAATALGLSVPAHRETLLESAVHVRELIKYRNFGLGTLMTTYGPGHPLEGRPVGLLEYYSLFPSSNTSDPSSDLLFLAMPISTNFHNALASNGDVSFEVADLYGLDKGRLAAGKMRVVLFGKIERVAESEVAECTKVYLEEHPDATWVESGYPHTTFFVRFNIEKVYAIGGFGNVAYIGWIPLVIYENAGAKMRSKKEVLSVWPQPQQPEGAEVNLFAEQIPVENRFTVQI